MVGIPPCVYASQGGYTSGCTSGCTYQGGIPQGVPGRVYTTLYMPPCIAQGIYHPVYASLYSPGYTYPGIPTMLAPRSAARQRAADGALGSEKEKPVGRGLPEE